MAGARSKYGLLGRLNIEDLYNAFLGLEQRQQVLAVGGAVLMLLALIIVPVTCATSKLGDLESEYDKNKKEWDSFMGRIGTYQAGKEALAQKRDQIGRGGLSGSLTTIVETLARESEIGDKIERLKPATGDSSSEYFDEEGVDVVLSGVSLSQAVSFLYKVENYQPPLRLKNLQLKTRYGKRNELTATMRIMTLKLKKEKGEEK